MSIKGGGSFQRLVDYFLDSPFVLVLVSVVYLSSLVVGRGVRVGICQQRTDRSQNRPHVVNRTPLVLQN